MPNIEITKEEAYALKRIQEKFAEAEPEYDKDEFVRQALSVLHWGYEHLQKKDEDGKSFVELFGDLQSTYTAIASILAEYRSKAKDAKD